MSVFDSIISGISDLGSSDTLGNLATLGSAAVKGIGSLYNSEQVKGSKEDALYRFLQNNSARMNTNMIDSFKVTKTSFDNANYSANAEDVQGYWNHLLQGYVSAAVNPQSQVSKY